MWGLQRKADGEWIGFGKGVVWYVRDDERDGE
jgi:hypothetical protein